VEPVRVELLFWDGCPSHPAALADLRAALAELGLDPASPRSARSPRTPTRGRGLRRVADDPHRRTRRQPPGDEPAGLTCRVYRRRDGRFSPTPDPDDLRDALRAALQEPAP
jgi:hypothetical protein